VFINYAGVRKNYTRKTKRKRKRKERKKTGDVQLKTKNKIHTEVTRNKKIGKEE
jgi:hypothetical protein